MLSLNLDELKPGMILALPIYNQQELLLLEKDTALTKKRIWMLKTWGIDQVCVKSKTKENPEEIAETEMGSRENIEKELKEKFSDVADDPVMVEIMKAAGRHLQKSLSDPDEENEPT